MLQIRRLQQRENQLTGQQHSLQSSVDALEAQMSQSSLMDQPLLSEVTHTAHAAAVAAPHRSTGTIVGSIECWGVAGANTEEADPLVAAGA